MKTSEAIETSNNELDMLRTQYKQAFSDYIDWTMQMASKYGSNGVAKLKDLPKEEIKHGSQLELSYKKLQKQIYILEKQLKNSI